MAIKHHKVQSSHDWEQEGVRKQVVSEIDQTVDKSETIQPAINVTSPALPSSVLARRLIELQHTVGNKAVQRLLALRQSLSGPRTAIQRITSGVIQRAPVTVDDYQSKLGNGNYSLGSCTRAEANKIATDWLGYKPTSKISLDSSRLRQYRKPSFKPNWGEWQANLEERAVAKGRWTSNGHLTITDGNLD